MWAASSCIFLSGFLGTSNAIRVRPPRTCSRPRKWLVAAGRGDAAGPVRTGCPNATVKGAHCTGIVMKRSIGVLIHEDRSPFLKCWENAFASVRRTSIVVGWRQRTRSRLFPSQPSRPQFVERTRAADGLTSRRCQSVLACYNRSDGSCRTPSAGRPDDRACGVAQHFLANLRIVAG